MVPSPHMPTNTAATLVVVGQQSCIDLSMWKNVHKLPLGYNILGYMNPLMGRNGCFLNMTWTLVLTSPFTGIEVPNTRFRDICDPPVTNARKLLQLLYVKSMSNADPTPPPTQTASALVHVDEWPEEAPFHAPRARSAPPNACLLPECDSHDTQGARSSIWKQFMACSASGFGLAPTRNGYRGLYREHVHCSRKLRIIGQFLLHMPFKQKRSTTPTSLFSACRLNPPPPIAVGETETPP